MGLSSRGPGHEIRWPLPLAKYCLVAAQLPPTVEGDGQSAYLNTIVVAVCVVL